MRSSRILFQPSSPPRKSAPTSKSKPPPSQSHRGASPLRRSPPARATTPSQAAKAPVRAKPLFYAVAVSAVTVAGTWWGATLKEQWQTRQGAKAQVQTAKPDDESATAEIVHDSGAGVRSLAEVDKRAEERAERERQELIESLLDRKARLMRVRDELTDKIQEIKTRRVQSEKFKLGDAGAKEGTTSETNG